MLILDPNEKLKLDEQDLITLNSTFTPPKMMIEKPTKSFVDSLYENNRNGWDMSTVFNEQDNEFDNSKLFVLYSITSNRNWTTDNEVSYKKYVDDESNKINVLRFSQSLQNYRKVPVRNFEYNLK